ncbi:MAG: M24 family metallopeptidase [Planctomycetes bacterium]|nr:M24 family metallopeptidase [Planctomycetota bacterium]
MSPTDRIAARRADIDAKQQLVSDVLEAMGCEAVVLLMPAHVAWLTAGLNVRGLIADSERPGVYTNGRQRWLLSSNVDSQRLFDEELDQLGFQLKEWTWLGGRSDLLYNLTLNRKVAGDRPFPNVPMVNDRLRPLLRVLSAYERERYRELGAAVAHAVEATARTLRRGDTEEEVAGQLGHRLLHHGIEPTALAITADGRGAKFRRSGFTPAPIASTCVLQATGQRDGLFVTVARTVSFGPPPDELRAAQDLAMKIAAVYHSFTVRGATIAPLAEVAAVVLAGTPFEFDGRLTQPGYGTGHFPAEELRRAGQDEPLSVGQAVVWQPRVGPAVCADTVLVTETGAEPVTPPTEWPFKRISVRGTTADVPDVLARE